MALAGDGLTLAVAAYGDDSAATGIGGDQLDDSANYAGAIFVFDRSTGNWEQQAYIKASNAGRGDQFGSAIALAADGNTLAVAARLEDSDATAVDGNQTNDDAPETGAVYVFERSFGAWSQQAYIKASNTGEGDQFGAVISLSGDGLTLAVQASDDSNAKGINDTQTGDDALNSGAIYVFTQQANGWSQQAYIKASNTGEGDAFGFSAALSADGNLLAVGAPGEDGGTVGLNGDQGSNGMPDSGAVYLFRRTDGEWTQTAYLKALNAGDGDGFGQSIATSRDGNVLAVGPESEDSSGDNPNANDAPATGAVYLF